MPRESTTTSRLLIATIVCGGVSLLWLRFNARPPARGSLFPHDFIYYFYPQMNEVGRRLSSGELPLWNPYPCAGLPLLAAWQPAVFYPGTWLAAVLPAEQVLSTLVLLHLLLAAGSAAALFRMWGVASSLSAGFGVVFAYACVLGQSFWPPEAATIAWTPWLLLCTEHILRAERAGRWWLGLLAGTALQLLAGFPQFAVYGLQLLLPYVLLRLWQQMRAGDPQVARRGVRVLAGLALGFGVALVQIAPSLELMGSSDRAVSFTPQEIHYLRAGKLGGLPDPRLTTVLQNAVTPAPRLMTFELKNGTGYLGTGTLVLIAVALVARRRDPLALSLAAGGVCWLVLSDGYLGFGRDLFKLYSSLPGMSLFRAPGRLLFTAFACWIALAALGADASTRADRREWLPVALAAGLAVGLIAVVGSAAATWRAIVAMGWVLGALLLPRLSAVRGAWSLLGACLLILDVAAATGPFGSLRAPPINLAHKMRAGTQQLISAPELDRLRQELGYERIEFVARGRQVRPLMGVGDAGDLYRLACYETLLPGQWPALSKRVRSPDFRSAVMSNLPPESLATLYDIASVSKIVRGPAPRQAPEILQNADALARVYLVADYEVVPNDEALERVASGTFDYRQTVLLDSDPGVLGAGVEPLGRAEIVSYEPERVEIEAHASSDALLVLTDTYAPGWRAAVDGRPVAIHRANGLFRAVRLTAGKHRIVFEYAPRSLALGAAASCLSLLAGGVFLLWDRRRGG